MFNSFICLSLLCHCVLNVEIPRDSAEDSDESLESLEINKVKETPPGAAKCLAIAEKIRSDSCLVEVCSASCPGSLDTRQEKGIQKELCHFGCKFMLNVFDDVKGKFLNTKAEYLLGNALDQCWEGCVDNFSEGVSICTAGCDAMRDIQKKIIKKKDLSSDEQREVKNEEFMPEAGNLDMEKIPVVRTYVLWRPQSMDMEGVYSSYNTMVSLMQEMFGDFVTEGEDVERRGYQDDKRQLSLPRHQPGSEALTSQETSQTEKAKVVLENLYQNMRERFDNVALQLRTSLQSPKYRELMFYVLMTICCFLILTAIFDILSENKKQHQEDVEDHYLLEDTAIKVKLPSYEECMQDHVKHKLPLHVEQTDEIEEKCDKI